MGAAVLASLGFWEAWSSLMGALSHELQATGQIGAHDAIGVEAGKTLLLEREKLSALADQHRISIFGLHS